MFLGRGCKARLGTLSCRAATAASAATGLAAAAARAGFGSSAALSDENLVNFVSGCYHVIAALFLFLGLQTGGERGRGLVSIYLAAQCLSLASCFAGVAAAGADEEEYRRLFCTDDEDLEKKDDRIEKIAAMGSKSAYLAQSAATFVSKLVLVSVVVRNTKEAAGGK